MPADPYLHDPSLAHAFGATQYTIDRLIVGAADLRNCVNETRRTIDAARETLANIDRRLSADHPLRQGLPQELLER